MNQIMLKLVERGSPSILHGLSPSPTAFHLKDYMYNLQVQRFDHFHVKIIATKVFSKYNVNQCGIKPLNMETEFQKKKNVEATELRSS